MKTQSEIINRLREIVKEEFIESWLDTPNIAFGNKTPRQLIVEQNTHQIEDMIYRLSGEIPG